MDKKTKRTFQIPEWIVKAVAILAIAVNFGLILIIIAIPVFMIVTSVQTTNLDQSKKESVISNEERNDVIFTPSPTKIIEESIDQMQELPDVEGIQPENFSAKIEAVDKLSTFEDEILKFSYPNDWTITEEDDYFAGSEMSHILSLTSPNGVDVVIAYDMNLYECELPNGQVRTGGAACPPYVRSYFDSDDFVILNNKNAVAISRYKNLMPKDSLDASTDQIWIGEEVKAESEEQAYYFGDGGIDMGFQIGKIKNLNIMYTYPEVLKPSDLLNKYTKETNQADKIIGSLEIK